MASTTEPKNMLEVFCGTKSVGQVAEPPNDDDVEICDCEECAYQAEDELCELEAVAGTASSHSNCCECKARLLKTSMIPTMFKDPTEIENFDEYMDGEPEHYMCRACFAKH